MTAEANIKTDKIHCAQQHQYSLYTPLSSHVSQTSSSVSSLLLHWPHLARSWNSQNQLATTTCALIHVWKFVREVLSHVCASTDEQLCFPWKHSRVRLRWKMVFPKSFKQSPCTVLWFFVSMLFWSLSCASFCMMRAWFKAFWRSISWKIVLCLIWKRWLFIWVV